MNKGNVFIISGPSGSGKDTLLSMLFKKKPELLFSISSITRSMRKGEKEGEKYNFVSREKFEDLIKKDELLEYNTYVNNYYGTPKSRVMESVENGLDIVIEVDVNGAEQIRHKLKDAISIFIMPPSFDELYRRLSGRGTETDSAIKERMSSALNEIKRANEFDYIVVNENLNTAVENLILIVESSHLRIQNQKKIINEVLKKC